MPLRMACGTSFALPAPYPTTAEPGSPTTTSAANDKFLPPLTTLVTRLIEMSWSLSRSPLAEILCLLFVAIRFLCGFLAVCLVLVQACLTRGVDQCLDPAMIDIAAAVE